MLGYVNRLLTSQKCIFHLGFSLDLADSANDPFLRMTLGTARSCHANFYNDWMEQEELEGYLPDIQAFVISCSRPGLISPKVNGEP